MLSDVHHLRKEAFSVSLSVGLVFLIMETEIVHWWGGKFGYRENSGPLEAYRDHGLLQGKVEYSGEYRISKVLASLKNFALDSCQSGIYLLQNSPHHGLRRRVLALSSPLLFSLVPFLVLFHSFRLIFGYYM